MNSKPVSDDLEDFMAEPPFNSGEDTFYKIPEREYLAAVSTIRDLQEQLAVAKGVAVNADIARDTEIHDLQQQVKSLREGLTTIQSEARRDGVRLVHLKRCISAQCQALKTGDEG